MRPIAYLVPSYSNLDALVVQSDRDHTVSLVGRQSIHHVGWLQAEEERQLRDLSLARSSCLTP